MRKVLTVAAVAAGATALSAAPATAGGGNSGVDTGDVSLINADASSLAHWQICGQNILTQSIGQVCDNRDHIGEGSNSGVTTGDASLGNIDLSDALHWQVCGQNVAIPPPINEPCRNQDHLSE